jgi:hypothetical protein
MKNGVAEPDFSDLLHHFFCFRLFSDYSPVNDRAVALFQAALLLEHRYLQLLDAFLFCCARKRTVCVPAVPKPVASRVLKNIFFSENFPVGNRLDLARQRNRIVDRSERVRKNMEFPFREQC